MELNLPVREILVGALVCIKMVQTDYRGLGIGQPQQMALMGMFSDEIQDLDTSRYPSLSGIIVPEPSCDDMLHVVLLSKNLARIMTGGLAVAMN